MTPDEEADIRATILHRAASAIMEHFDSVQIVATKFAGDAGTYLHSYGRGDMYARRGAAREWLLRQDTLTKLDVKRNDDEATA